MPKIFIIVGIVASLMFGTFFVAPQASALECSILPQSICDDSQVADAGDPSTSGVFQLIIWVLRIMTGLVGVAAVGALVYAGIMYSSAGGNSSQVEKSKTIITDTVIGLLAYGAMFFVLNWLVPGGVFGS